MFNFIKFASKKPKMKKDVERDAQGNALFEIAIKDKSEVLAPFSLDSKDTINVEFANVLDNTAKSFSKKEKLHLNLKCDKLSDKEKESFSLAIKNYYFNALVEDERKLKNNIFLFWVMIALSIVSLAVLFITNFFAAPWIVIEVIDIIAWVFVWEAVDLLAFQRSLLRYDKQHDYALYKMKITFEN